MNKRLLAYYVTIAIIVLIAYLYWSLNQQPAHILSATEIHCLSLQSETATDVCNKFWSNM